MRSVEIPLIDKLSFTKAVEEVDLGLVKLFEEKISLAYGIDREKLLFMYHDKITLSFLNSMIKMTSLIQEMIELKIEFSLNIHAVHVSFKDKVSIEVQLTDALSPEYLEKIVKSRKQMRLLNLKYSQLNQKIIMTSNNYNKHDKVSTRSRIANEL